MACRLYLRLDDGPLEPAEFRSRCEYDGSTRYEVCCPKCGVTTILDAAVHTVMRGGAVCPIWPCANQGCSYVEWIALTEICQ